MTLQKYLDSKRLSYNEFSRRSGIPLASVSRYARGLIMPGMKRAAELKKATGGKVNAAGIIEAYDNCDCRP